MNKLSILIVACVSLISCGNKSVNNVQPKEAYKQVSPDFNADSTYIFVENQVAFGPRVPNTTEHSACADYLVSELKRFGAEVIEQKADLKAYNGTVLKARNIIASFNPENKERIMLFAHWDTRPYADHDPNPDNYRKPILGANDGGSGVGVLLEIARMLNEQPAKIGIDIILFDAEDYGEPAFDKSLITTQNWWCLGSQYWAENPHVPNYTAKFGILLDMVGGYDATFLKEYHSKLYAGGVVEKVWATARLLGYGKYFIDKSGGAITDDHVPVNEIRRIPSIDIIQYNKDTDSGFGSYWHTMDDNMNNVSKETLKAVGQTVAEVIYKER
ncbi:MAG: M28 family peptidase [Dysgonomonas sp.]